MRLIDADALLDKVQDYGEGQERLMLIDPYWVRKAPTIERPHGEWLSHYEYCKKHDCIPSGLIAFWWCNQCEQGVEIQTNFCPNCGASMRKEGDPE